MNNKLQQLFNLAKEKVPALDIQRFPTHFSLSIKGKEVMNGPNNSEGCAHLSTFLSGLLVGVNQNVLATSFFSMS